MKKSISIFSIYCLIGAITFTSSSSVFADEYVPYFEAVEFKFVGDHLVESQEVDLWFSSCKTEILKHYEFAKPIFDKTSDEKTIKRFKATEAIFPDKAKKMVFDRAEEVINENIANSSYTPGESLFLMRQGRVGAYDENKRVTHVELKTRVTDNAKDHFWYTFESVYGRVGSLDGKKGTIITYTKSIERSRSELSRVQKNKDELDMNIMGSERSLESFNKMMETIGITINTNKHEIERTKKEIEFLDSEAAESKEKLSLLGSMPTLNYSLRYKIEPTARFINVLKHSSGYQEFRLILSKQAAYVINMAQLDGPLTFVFELQPTGCHLEANDRAPELSHIKLGIKGVKIYAGAKVEENMVYSS